MKNIKFYLKSFFLCTTILTYTNHAMEGKDDQLTSINLHQSQLQAIPNSQSPEDLQKEEQLIDDIYEGRIWNIDDINPLTFPNIQIKALNDHRYARLLIRK